MLHLKTYHSRECWESSFIQQGASKDSEFAQMPHKGTPIRYGLIPKAGNPLMKQLAIPLMELLAIPLGYPKSAAKWLVMSCLLDVELTQPSPCGIVSKARKRGKQASRVAAARKKFSFG